MAQFGPGQPLYPPPMMMAPPGQQPQGLGGGINPMLMMGLNMMKQGGPSRMPINTGPMVGNAGIDTMQMMQQQAMQAKKRKLMEKQMEQADKEMELKTKRLEQLTKRMKAEEKLQEQLGLAQFDFTTPAGRQGAGHGLMQMGGQAGNMGLFGQGAALAGEGYMPPLKPISVDGKVIGHRDAAGNPRYIPRGSQDPFAALVAGMGENPVTPQGPGLGGAPAPEGPGFFSGLGQSISGMFGGGQPPVPVPPQTNALTGGDEVARLQQELKGLMTPPRADTFMGFRTQGDKEYRKILEEHRAKSEESIRRIKARLDELGYK